MTRLRAQRDIALNHRLLYKGEIREVDPDVARHYLTLYPDALEDVTPKPTTVESEPVQPVAAEPVTEPVPASEPKPARRRKSQTAVE